MAISISVQAPPGAVMIGGDEPRASMHPSRPRGEPRDPDSAFGTACRDVIDEVRFRMAVRGFQWD